MSGGRAIVIIPGTSHLQFAAAKTPGLAGAQASGTEAALEAGRQAVAFRYSGVLNDLTAMTVGDCAMNVELKEGRVYTAVAGFDGRNFTIRINDITGRKRGWTRRSLRGWTPLPPLYFTPAASRRG
jgi:hypothetical protein